VLVPPLIAILLLGGPWIVIAIAVATGLAAFEVFSFSGTKLVTSAEGGLVAARGEAQVLY